MAETKGISRRNFIGAGVAAVGAAGVATLSGCNKTPAPAPAPEIPRDSATLTVELNPQEEILQTETDFSPLFQTLKVGNLEFRNRFVKTSAGSDVWNPEPGSHELNANYLDYYENFAKGGCAVVYLESAIAKFTSLNAMTRTISGWLYEDGFEGIPAKMKPVADRVHAHGAYLGYQFGPCTVDIEKGTKEDIQWSAETCGKVAAAMQAAGVDIICLHFANGPAWLTQRGNVRTDEYGWQSVENRTRFHCEHIKAVKAATNGMPVQILMDTVEENAQELGNSDGYITIEESVENAKQFIKAGADALYLRSNVVGRHVCQFGPDMYFSGFHCEGTDGFGTRLNFKTHFDGMFESRYSGAGVLLNCAEYFKKHGITVPVGVAGYEDPRTAPNLIVGAIREGKADFLMMNRPLTVDPEYVNKLAAGKRDEIAPCTRCLHCHFKGIPAEFGGSGPEWCRVNPITQRAYVDFPEGYVIPPAATPKKIVVVGAGPAGLEAARTAAIRGHQVTLLEKKSSLGGLVNTAHAFKGEHERLGDLVAYWTKQMEVQGVTVKTGVEADLAAIQAEKPDGVIIATGGKLPTGRVSAAGNIKLYSADNAASVAEDNIILLGAGAQAVDIAMFLIAQGKTVRIVHEGEKTDIGKEHSAWMRLFNIQYLYNQGVKIYNCAKDIKVTADGVTWMKPSGIPKTIACDAVIECWDREPDTDLLKAVQGAGIEAIAAGDCAENDDHRSISMAVKNGHIAGRYF
ncbi:MAG: FAD-dependent oxidoreductase [Eggerthellaceae bacterium]|nr:FAD-dependent oxidoreductase [Eggerthellaceae bacterium]